MTDPVKRAMDAAFAVGEAQADGVDPLALAGLVAEMNAAELDLRRAMGGKPPKSSSPRKTKQQLADEAYIRLNTPDQSGALPGQASFLEVDEAPADTPPSIGLVPLACPNCSRGMTLAHGWAYSREAPWTIQCPSCGKRYAVSEEDHHAYRKAVQDHYAAMKAAPLVKTKRRRDRGAR